MSANREYQVGQTVLIDSVNRRGRPPYRTTVTKVGRTLVYVEQYGRDRAFRIDGGHANDRYQHEWLETEESYQAKQDRNELIQRLVATGLRIDHGFGNSFSDDKLRRILEVVEG